MFHVIGLVTNVRAPLMHGGALLMSDGFEAGRTLARMANPMLAITHDFAVPQMAAMLRDHPSYGPDQQRRLTGIFSGGAPHAAAAIRRWTDDGIALVDGFGMSEGATISCTAVDCALIDARAGSAGVTMPGIVPRVVNASGKDCPPGAPGELRSRATICFANIGVDPMKPPPSSPPTTGSAPATSPPSTRMVS